MNGSFMSSGALKESFMASGTRALVQNRDISGSDLSNNPDGPAIFSGQSDR